MELIRFFPIGEPVSDQNSHLYLNKNNKLLAFINCMHGSQHVKYPYEYEGYDIKEKRKYFIKSNLTYFL